MTMTIPLEEAVSRLGLSFDELKKKKTPEELFAAIKAGYKKQALANHPDKNKDPGATELFKSINAAYKELAAEFESGNLAALFSNSPKHAAPPKSSAVKPQPAHSIEKFVYIDVSDAMKNSLYAYYEARIGGRIEREEEEAGFDAMRTMLSHILGISSFDFKLNYKHDKGYVIRSSKPGLINTIQEFLNTIQDYDLDKLKSVSQYFEMPLAAVQTLLKREGIRVNPDVLTVHIKNAMKLDNTSTIHTSYDLANKKYHVWVKPVKGVPMPDFLGTAVSLPKDLTARGSEDSALVLPKQIEPVDNSTVQLAFVLDVTSSMSGMLSAAKKTLRTIGSTIEQTFNTKPKIFGVFYHDYSDEGVLTSASSTNWSWSDYNKNRIRDEHEIAFGIPDCDEAYPVTTKIQEESNPRYNMTREGGDTRDIRGRGESSDLLAMDSNTKPINALNYFGKRDKNDPEKMPKFASAEKISDMLDAVNAEGGGDIPEMLEAALAIATLLDWNKPVRTLYMALDAPPHNHFEDATEDSYKSAEAIKAAQDKLVNDPALKKALNPEDWVTQALILAKKGVKVNPLVCTDNQDVLFLATFMAVLTGGTVIKVKDGQWDKLEPIIEHNTLVDCIEAGITNTALVEPSNLEFKALEPPASYRTAVLEMIQELNLGALHSTKKPLAIEEEHAQITTLAQKVRSVYSKKIKAFTLRPSKPIADSSKFAAIEGTIKERMLHNRSESPALKTISSTPTPKKPIQETKTLDQLLVACQTYYNHFPEDARNASLLADSLDKEHDAVWSLTLNKCRQMSILIEILTSDKTDDEKLCSFKESYPIAKAVIEQHRDTPAIRFLKHVANILSLGLAGHLGIWKVQGEEAARQMEDIDVSLKTPK